MGALPDDHRIILLQKTVAQTIDKLVTMVNRMYDDIINNSDDSRKIEVLNRKLHDVEEVRNQTPQIWRSGHIWRFIPRIAQELALHLSCPVFVVAATSRAAQLYSVHAMCISTSSVVPQNALTFVFIGTIY